MATSGLLDPAINILQGQIAQLGRKISALERNQRSNYNVQNTAIEAGGALTFNSPDGSTQLVVGSQSDGTLTTKVIGQVVPPKAPSTPVAGSGINGIWLSWDGLMADGTTPLADFSAVQVHMSTTQNFTPSSATLQGHMLGAGLFGLGPLTPGQTYWVALQALNEAGNLGPASGQTSAVPLSVPSGIPAGSLSGLQIQTGTITTAQIAAAAGILGSQIANGTLTTANLLAGSITAALLAANLIIAGAVDGTVITGSTLQNSSDDPKTSINPDGSITITNEASTVIFSIGDDGTIDWYSESGQILMELQPGGTQLIYASLTGPSGWSFEPAGHPGICGQLTSATSSTTYTVPVSQAVPAGQAVQIFATSSGATAVTAVADSKGNTYSLSQSQVSGQELQVYRCDSITDGLATSDTWTITYAAANTQVKTIVALTESGMASTGLQDFAGTASGTSTTPAVTATTAATSTEDVVLFAVATPTAPSAVADGWQQIISLNTAGGTWLTLYYGTTINGSTISASATITSGAWGAVLLGLVPAPANPVATSSWLGSGASVAVTSLWAGDGSFSLKVTSTAAVGGWGAVSPKFTVQSGASVSMQCQVETPAALAGVSCGFNWFDATGSSVGSTVGDLGTVACTAGSITEFTVTGATAPANAAFGQFYVTDTDAVSGLVMNVDVVQVPGGLVFSNSPVPGVDKFGNPYEEGINFIGLPGLTNVFGVEDPFGNQLLTIDSSGNINAQTLNAVNDVTVAGQSLVTTILPPVPDGALPTGYPSAYSTGTLSNNQYPATSIGTSETGLFYVSVPVTPGRTYLVGFSNLRIQCSSTSAGAKVRVRATTDGSTPSTASDIIVGWFGSPEPSTSAAVAAALKLWTAPAGVTTLNMMLTLHVSTGTCALTEFGGTTFANTDNQLICMDVGGNAMPNNWIPLQGGTSSKTLTQTWLAANGWSFYGSGALRSKGGSLYQGEPSGNPGGVGSQYSYMDFTSVASFLNGVTITAVHWAELRLYCLHSWYNAGMTVGLWLGSSFNNGGTLLSSPTDQWHIGEGQLLTHTLASGFLANFMGGNPWMMLGANPRNSGSLEYYGYFWGVGSTTAYQPALTVNYTTT